MAIETAEEEAKAAEASATEPAKDDQGKKGIGPIDRATELFVIMAFPYLGFVLYTGDLDLTHQLLFVALFIILSLIGGVLTNVTYKAPPETKTAVETAPAEAN